MWKLVFLLLVSAVWAEEEAKQSGADRLSSAVNRGSINLLKEVIASSDGHNVVTSPLGVFILLSLYSAGTNGKLRDDITSVLGVNNYTTLFNSYSSLSRDLASVDANVLTVANKVYVAAGSKFTESFEDAAKSYRTDLDELNFKDAKSAVATINKWADEKTQGHIKDPVTEDMITPDVAAALFNVIFFKGHWKKPFVAEDTKEMDFHTKSGAVKKQMMSKEQSLNYLENPELGARMAELLYEEKGFRMVIVLPNEADGLPSMMQKISANPDLLNTEMKRFERNYYTLLDLKMPKFDIKTKLDLNDILAKMGLSRLFSDDASEIVKDSSVTVSKAFQEAFIKVDEKGATAGAFTGFIGVGLAALPPQPVKFHATHPFLFAILHENTILFIGTYNE